MGHHHQESFVAGVHVAIPPRAGPVVPGAASWLRWRTAIGSKQQVYDEAKKLVAAGLATAKDEASGGRPRTVYRITARGRRELARWLGESSAPTKLEAESLVRVFFADAGGLDDLRRTLDGFGAEAADRLGQLDQFLAESSDPDYPYEGRAHINALAIRFQMDLYRTIARWAEWADRQTEEWVDVNDPGVWDWRKALESP